MKEEERGIKEAMERDGRRRGGRQQRQVGGCGKRGSVGLEMVVNIRGGGGGRKRE